jgi:plastocyanin
MLDLQIIANAGDDCDAAAVRGNIARRASDQPSTANVAIKIDNFVFGPQAITVPVGTTVTWTNSDDIPHTAVSIDGVFKSGDGHGRKVLLHLYQGRNVFLLLLSPSEMTSQIVVKW